jgi:hypothetical protein
MSLEYREHRLRGRYNGILPINKSKITLYYSNKPRPARALTLLI